MRRNLIPALVISMALLAGGCFGDDADDVSTAPAIGDDADIAVDSGDGVDDCGQGQAWPDDPDFREAVCRPFMAMLDLIGGDASGIPGWNERITGAILGYADDRAASMAELNAVTAEIQAAG